MEKDKKLPPLEGGLLQAMRAIDNQIAREMQRDPKSLEGKGVLKWEPFDKRIEQITAFILDTIGERHIELDSLLVLAQATSKALTLLSSDLESMGLGKVRTAYCLEALRKMMIDIERAERGLKDPSDLN